MKNLIRSIFGFNYAPGSVPDRIIEAYAGPHVFLNSWSYDSVGNLRSLNIAEKFAGAFTNPLNIGFETPIVISSVYHKQQLRGRMVNPWHVSEKVKLRRLEQI